MATFLISAALALVVLLIVSRMIINKRRGRSGCSGCSGCAARDICGKSPE